MALKSINSSRLKIDYHRLILNYPTKGRVSKIKQLYLCGYFQMKIGDEDYVFRNISIAK